MKRGVKPIRRSVHKTFVPSQKGVARLGDNFLEAAYCNDLPKIKDCLEKGVDPNQFNKDFGITSLHIAAERGDIVLAKLLLEHPGTRVDIRTFHGLTCMHLACIFNRKAFVLFLLQNGVNPNLVDKHGRTALHYCAIWGATSIVFHLLRYRADVNVLDVFGDSALSIFLLHNRNIFIAKILLRNGADLRKVEAERNLHIFFECILQCKNDSELDYVELLINHGVNVNIRDTNTGRNCLHFAAITGFVPLVIYLVTLGARIFERDLTGRTPAQTAMAHGNYVVAVYLIKKYLPPLHNHNLRIRYEVDTISQSKKQICYGENVDPEF